MKKLLSIIFLALPVMVLGQTTFNKQIEYYQIGYYEQIPFENPSLKKPTIHKEGNVEERNGYAKVVIEGNNVMYMNVVETEFEIFKWVDNDSSLTYSEGDILVGNIKENIGGWYDQDEYGDYIHPRKFVYISYESNYITLFYEEKEKYSRYKLID